MSSRPAQVPGKQYILKKTSLSMNFKRKPKKCKYTIKKIKPTMYQAKATEKWRALRRVKEPMQTGSEHSVGTVTEAVRDF